MTDREKAIVMAYTGVCMLAGEKFSIFHKYVEDILERKVFTHEMGVKSVAEEIKQKSINDFLNLCKEGAEVGRTCKNVGMDYAEVDQFVCSECGIELQDWNSVERCEDGEVIYHEYTFRFCPHCGRKIVDSIVSRRVNEEKECDIAFKIIKKEEE